jgi:ABC-type transporter Mla MlaB component
MSRPARLAFGIAIASEQERGHGMLRITVHDGPDHISLKLEGALAGPWVAELEDSWRATRQTLEGRALRLDLTAVHRVDRAGGYLLALLRRSGVQLIASGTLMTELVHSITGDWDE